jgi:hypothetical protein
MTSLILWTDCSNRGFQFHKRGQLFIRTHNETLSVAAMHVSNPDCSPADQDRARIVFDCQTADRFRFLNAE